ncbi:hypothetical protein MRX96_014265 [Rhipicephalus microplus]
MWLPACLRVWPVATGARPLPRFFPTSRCAILAGSLSLIGARISRAETYTRSHTETHKLTSGLTHTRLHACSGPDELHPPFSRCIPGGKRKKERENEARGAPRKRGRATNNREEKEGTQKLAAPNDPGIRTKTGYGGKKKGERSLKNGKVGLSLVSDPNTLVVRRCPGWGQWTRRSMGKRASPLSGRLSQPHSERLASRFVSSEVFLLSFL